MRSAGILACVVDDDLAELRPGMPANRTQGRVRSPEKQKCRTATWDCYFARGRRPSEEEIKIWNAFLLKRGWRDDASADLKAAKKREGLEDRDNIQTWVDLHDVEEGRTPRPFCCG